MIETGKSDVSMMVNDYTLMRQYVDDVFEVAGTHGVGLVNGAALAMGLLSGRDPDTVGTPKWTPPATSVEGARRVHAWCAERGVPVLALALQFAVRQRRFDCTLIGAATPAEVVGCWDAASMELPETVWDELPGLLDEVREPEDQDILAGGRKN